MRMVIELTLPRIIGTLGGSKRQFHGKMSILDRRQKRATACIIDIAGRFRVGRVSTARAGRRNSSHSGHDFEHCDAD